MKLRKSVKEKWLKALRSGKYKQTVGALRNDYGYCCLGVLCDVHRLTVKKKGYKFEGDDYLDVHGVLPTIVGKWAGLEITGDNWCAGNVIISNGITLTTYNDDKNYSFKK